MTCQNLQNRLLNITVLFNRDIDLGKIMWGRDCILNFSVDRNEQIQNKQYSNVQQSILQILTSH
jgi:hypothetical protein